MPLDRIRIVLVKPTHPGNIGAVARAMKNMGLRRLYLVEPRDFAAPEAGARASGADDLLAGATVVSGLNQALEGCRLVIGTSVRKRRISWPALSPRMAAEELLAQAAGGDAALVFGPEKSGLDNDQLDRCQYVVTIPVDPSFPSLNLAAAVLIMAYELRLAAGHAGDRVHPGIDGDTGNPPASAEEMERFYAHLDEVLVQIGFIDPENPRKLMRRLHRLFNRTRLDQNELNILRGILKAVQTHPRHDNLDTFNRKLI